MEESREMVTMEDHVDGVQPNYLQVAKLLREKLNGFLEKLQCLLNMATLHKVDSHDFVDPVLWERLPRELLVLILARLPVSKINSLRCQLSKEWTINMEFNRACDEVNPNMIALISYPLANNEFSVRIFDSNKFVWLYVYRFRLTHRGDAPNGILIGWKPMASDGGLVCFVSMNKYTKASPLCIVVVNPLTRVQHELPPLLRVYTTPPILLHIKVDSKTKEYKVVVVGKSKGGCYPIETYDSVSRQWRRSLPSWGRIWGHACEYKSSHCNYFRLKSSRLCTIDFEQRQIELLDDRLLFQSQGSCVVQHTLAGDRIFVLHKKLNQDDIGSGFYSITEYQSQNNVEKWEEWAPVKTYNQCFPKEKDKLFDLHGCQDGVVLCDRFNSTKEICCFMNFSTNEWHNSIGNLIEDRYVSLMCRVFWNITP